MQKFSDKLRQNKTLTGCLSHDMIFIDFALLHMPHFHLFRHFDMCYDLTSYVTQTAKIIVRLIANFGKVFIKRLQTFFFNFCLQ